jgi:hypothetical protein
VLRYRAAVDSPGTAELGLVIASVLGGIADIITALAWPLLIGAVVWFLRDPVRALARRVSGSAERVSIGAQGLSIELASAVETVPSEAATALGGIRVPEPAPRVVDSAAMTMFAQLQTEAPAPYLVVDLGDGKEWLSSRLFVFAILLRAMRQTRTLVFVDTQGGVRGRFVGLASNVQIRWALARAYPWLEADYAEAYSNATVAQRSPNSAAESFVVDQTGRFTQDVAWRIATNFVFAVQRAPAAGTPLSPDEWVDLERPEGPFKEHATWLGGAEVERALGAALHRFAYIREDGPRPLAELGREALATQDEDAVALVDSQHRFRDRVIDRRHALEAVAQTAANP